MSAEQAGNRSVSAHCAGTDLSEPRCSLWGDQIKTDRLSVFIRSAGWMANASPSVCSERILSDRMAVGRQQTYLRWLPPAMGGLLGSAWKTDRRIRGGRLCERGLRMDFLALFPLQHCCWFLKKISPSHQLKKKLHVKAQKKKQVFKMFYCFSFHRWFLSTCNVPLNLLENYTPSGESIA